MPNSDQIEPARKCEGCGRDCAVLFFFYEKRCPKKLTSVFEYPPNCFFHEAQNG